MGINMKKKKRDYDLYFNVQMLKQGVVREEAATAMLANLKLRKQKS